MTRSGKRYIFAQKFEIELRISFESVTLAEYDAENRTFVAPSLPALYAYTYTYFRVRYCEILRAEFQLRNTCGGDAHNFETTLYTSARSGESTPLQREKADATP